MSKALSKLKKLRGRSRAELKERGSQVLAAFAERRGWSPRTRLPRDASFFALLDPALTQSPTPTDLLAHFRTRTAPTFFPAFAEPHTTRAELRRRFGAEAESPLLTQARALKDGKVDLLGHRALDFGKPLDWHLEPTSGLRAPLVHWSKIDFLDPRVAGDKKFTWELNRCQHFTTLGRAYWHTDDESFAETFCAQVTSWMNANPPTLGVNWASGLEVALRAISWLWALYFFKDSAALTPVLFLRLLKFFSAHARHIETYLSTYFAPNTHLTGEALGLFYLGTLLPEFKRAARWRTLGQSILLEQLDRHVLPDGVYFEQSGYYHRYTTDFYTHFLILLRANGEVIPSKVEKKLKGLLDHMLYITRPDGTTPFVGDDDGGRLVKLDQRAANDFRTVLSNGAALFERPDYKFVAGDSTEETLWLFGPEGVAKLEALEAREPAKQSAAFPESGFYVMRDGWTSRSNYLLFDCGPHGILNCGHAHADALSFNLAARGQTLLVDPGTFTYTRSKEVRDWFRSSLAHNTLTVDGESSSVPDGPFSWKSIARAEASAWISRERFDYVEGKHNGYLRLPAPVAHTRSILFLKNDYWIMRDQVRSSAEHLYALWFHLNPDLDGSVDSEHAMVIREFSNGVGLKIFAFAADGHWGCEEAAVSHCYGEKEQAAVCVFSANAADEQFVTFLLPVAGVLPVAGALPRLRVSEVETIGGRAFEVISEKAVDLVMIRDGQRVETARMASDFDWTWARFSSAGASVPEELVLLGGQTLRLEGQEILKSRSRLNYLAASRKGDSEFRISDCGFRNGDPEAEIEIRNPKFAIRNS